MFFFLLAHLPRTHALCFFSTLSLSLSPLITVDYTYRRQSIFSLSPEHVKLLLLWAIKILFLLFSLWAIKIFFLLFSFPASCSLYFCSTDYLTLSFASVLLAWTEPYRRANTASCEANTYKHAATHTWNFSWWLFTIFLHHVRLPELNSEFCFLFFDHRVPIFLDTDDLSPHSLYSIWNFYWNHGLSRSVVFFSMNAIPNPYAHGFRLDNCTADCDVTVAPPIHSHEVFKYLLIQRPSPFHHFSAWYYHHSNLTSCFDKSRRRTPPRTPFFVSFALYSVLDCIEFPVILQFIHHASDSCPSRRTAASSSSFDGVWTSAGKGTESYSKTTSNGPGSISGRKWRCWNIFNDWLLADHTCLIATCFIFLRRWRRSKRWFARITSQSHTANVNCKF